MTPWQYMTGHGFTTKDIDQPVGAQDYVTHAGIFRVRVRVPLGMFETKPDLWVGYTAGGPLVERRSGMRYRDAATAMEDAIAVAQVFRSTR